LEDKWQFGLTVTKFVADTLPKIFVGLIVAQQKNGNFPKQSSSPDIVLHNDNVNFFGGFDFCRA